MHTSIIYVSRTTDSRPYHVCACCEQVLDNSDFFIQADDKYLLSIYGPVRWGVAGVGKIADDFACSLSMLPGAELAAAAAATDADRAANFAKRHGFARSYGSYKELAEDPNVCRLRALSAYAMMPWAVADLFSHRF